MNSLSADALASLRARLRSELPGTRPGHARVIHLVISDPLFVLSATAQQIAERAHVSSATVVRAARTAGFGGLPELKMALAQAVGASGAPTPRRSVAQARTAAQLGEAIIASHAESLQAAQSTLDTTQLESAVAVLRTARRVVVTGSGTSLPVATDAAFRLAMSGLTVQHSADSYSAELLAGLVGPQDLLIAVSHSGETRQTLDVVRAAQDSETPVAAITSFATSTLGRMADIPLVAVGSAHADQLVESSSRIAHLAVVDILHTALALTPDGGES